MLANLYSKCIRVFTPTWSSAPLTGTGLRCKRLNCYKRHRSGRWRAWRDTQSSCCRPLRGGIGYQWWLWHRPSDTLGQLGILERAGMKGSRKSHGRTDSSYEQEKQKRIIPLGQVVAVLKRLQGGLVVLSWQRMASAL